MLLGSFASEYASKLICVMKTQTSCIYIVLILFSFVRWYKSCWFFFLCFPVFFFFFFLSLVLFSYTAGTNWTWGNKSWISGPAKFSPSKPGSILHYLGMLKYNKLIVLLFACRVVKIGSSYFKLIKLGRKWSSPWIHFGTSQIPNISLYFSFLFVCLVQGFFFMWDLILWLLDIKNFAFIK